LGVRPTWTPFNGHPGIGGMNSAITMTENYWDGSDFARVSERGFLHMG
jgi:hypothetical protein